MERKELIDNVYSQYDEDTRLIKSRHGQLEYATTMHYVHKYLTPGAKVIEIGAGTGRYSIALAKEGYDVTALELADANIAVMKQNAKGIANITPLQGDATDLSRFADDTFDVTLVFGPMYHIYQPDEVNKAIDEAIRVTKPGGVILYAFISVFGIMYADGFYGYWAVGQKLNFDEQYRVLHYADQVFTGYDVTEFENLFVSKPVDYITTTGVDGLLEPIEFRSDFNMSDADFDMFVEWYRHFCEKRELLGMTNHLLYICRKK